MYEFVVNKFNIGSLTMEEVSHKKKREKRLAKKKIRKIKSSNFVRIWNDYFSNLPFVKHFNLADFLKGSYYLTFHTFFVIVVVFITLFNTSIIDLVVLLTVVSFDALSIVVLHGCPLTHMEKKYLGISGMDLHNLGLKHMNICYDCDHLYEQQIELMINVWSIVVFKIFIILLFKMFNLQLYNSNNLYNICCEYPIYNFDLKKLFVQ